jgi:hypothetical protein
MFQNLWSQGAERQVFAVKGGMRLSMEAEKLLLQQVWGVTQ